MVGFKVRFQGVGLSSGSRIARSGLVAGLSTQGLGLKVEAWGLSRSPFGTGRGICGNASCVGLGSLDTVLSTRARHTHLSDRLNPKP